MTEPVLAEGFSLRDRQCMFEGGTNHYLDFQYSLVAQKLSNEEKWEIKLTDPAAVKIILKQTEIIDVWVEEEITRKREEYLAREKKEQAHLAAAMIEKHGDHE